MVWGGHADCSEGFIECTSLSFSYDVYGIVTINYTMVHQSDSFCYTTEIYAGDRHFEGDVTNMSFSQVEGSVDWYETRVTLSAVTTD